MSQGRRTAGDSALRFDDLHDVGVVFLWNFLEPVRGAGWYHHPVALHKMVRFAAVDASAKPLVGSCDFTVNHRATGDDGGLAVEDIERIGFFVMDFNLAGCSTPIDRN